MEPVVSVIMPVYNAGEYLEPAINSVLNQSFQDFELLLIDDGATDGSGDICEAYAAKDSRVKLFRQQNKGICGARNLGLEKANGKYIAFCDHDDIFSSNHLEVAVQAIQKMCTDIVKFEYISEQWRTPQSCATKYHDALPEKLLDGKQLLQNHYFFHCTIRAIWNGIYSKTAIQKCGVKFDEQVRYGMEDYLFNIELLNQVNAVGFIPKCLYTHYNRSWQSTDCKYSMNKVNAIIAAANSEKRLLETREVFTTQRYIEGLLPYLDRIIVDQLLREGCDLSFKEKVAVLQAASKQEGLCLPKTVSLKQINLKKRLRLFLYQYNFIQALLAVYKLNVLKNKLL